MAKKLSTEERILRDEKINIAEKAVIAAEKELAPVEKNFDAMVKDARRGNIPQDSEVTSMTFTFGNRLAEVNKARRAVADLKNPKPEVAALPINLVSHEKE